MGGTATSPAFPALFLFPRFDVDAADFVLGRHAEGAGLLALDVANLGEDVALDFAELLVGELAELEPHLGFEKLFAKRRVVLRFGLGGRDDLVEDEAETADEERI